MRVKILELFRKRRITNYSLAKRLRARGVDVSIQGLDGYANARSMRLDVLCGLRAESGESWETFGKLLDQDFLPTSVK